MLVVQFFIKQFVIIIITGLLIVVFPYRNYGQNNSVGNIFITGVVMDKDSLNPLPETNILVNRLHGCASDSAGHFSFYVNTRDTLLFSCVGYKNFRFIVPDSLSSDEFIAGIVMSRDTMLLGEIIIYPRINPTQLKSDFLSYNGYDKNTANATRNLKVATYQSLAYDQPNDAAANQKMVLDQHTMHTEYKGLIPPDQMINFTAAIPIAIALVKQKKEEEKMRKLMLSILEEDALRQEYRDRESHKNDRK